MFMPCAFALIVFVSTVGVPATSVRTAESSFKDESVELEGLLSTLGNGDLSERRRAASELCRFPKRADIVVPAIIEALVDDDSVEVRVNAISSVVDFDKSAIPAIPHLIAAMGDESVQIRRAACWALGRFGSHSRGAIPGLVNALNDDDLKTRTYAVATLGQIGSDAVVGLDRILILLSDPEVCIRRESAEALGHIGNGDKKVIEALVAALDDKDGTVRRAAFEALPRLGGVGLAAIMDRFPDKSTAVLNAAEDAVLGLDDKVKKASLLVAALRSKNAKVRVWGAEQLWLGDAETLELALPVVCEVLRSKDNHSRSLLARALLSHEASVRAPIESLLNVLEDPDFADRKVIVLCIAGRGKDALPYLREAATKGQAAVRIGVAETLGWMNATDIQLLRELLNDEEVPVQMAAVKSCLELGLGAEQALPDLVCMRDNENADGQLRAKAREAVENIERERKE